MKKALIITILALTLTAGVGYYLMTEKGSIGLDSITEREDLKDTDEAKPDGTPTKAEDPTDNTAENPDKTDPQEDNVAVKKISVTPTLSTWGQDSEQNLEVNGFVAGVVENDGTCTLNLTRQEKVVTKSKKAVADAQTTTCGLIEIERSKLSAGTWSAFIEYSSSKHQGISNKVSIEIK